MKLFKRKEVEVEVDPRTPLEKQFEVKGQELGRKTGTLVQRTVNKIHKVKEKLETDGTMDKLRHFSDKIDDKIDSTVDKVTKKGKQLSTKVRAKKTVPEEPEEELFYE